MNPAETSNEILEDVLKQLDKLGTEKRKQILKKLVSSNIIEELEMDKSEKILDASSEPTIVDANKSQATESIQDEVEILDLHEPKMGTYKRKRSKIETKTLYIRTITIKFI